MEALHLKTNPPKGLKVGRVREQDGQQHKTLYPQNTPTEGLEVGRVPELGKHFS